MSQQLNVKHPRGIKFEASYEPDMKRMVKALKIVLESQPTKKIEKKAANS
ncbi:hypothetical protein GCM10011571_17530 [Marinithermofilum abyssi]|uniref:Uncharacterized protein n=1 Tax=Marinithermofilum abyssi TaxID=1571185 RepID=A0A8J2YCI7_9BACL|nr:hypothetical protein GCM10011571_17530 [Marinithermofilum abyssi]